MYNVLGEVGFCGMLGKIVQIQAHGTSADIVTSASIAVVNLMCASNYTYFVTCNMFDTLKAAAMYHRSNAVVSKEITVALQSIKGRY